MVAKLVFVLVAIVAVILGASYFTYLYYEREAEREHERRMAREQRDYDELMEYVDSERDDLSERDRESE